jgi:hydrogenase maturation protein HypF
MTSGNRSDEPIAHRDGDARERLAGIADRFLVHDRPIETRCDDSVTRVVLNAPMPIRRSRGQVPRPIVLPVAAAAGVLAVGGDLKSTFALARGRHAFVSHHIGDLGDLAARQEFANAIAHFERLLGVRPEVVAHDLHPGYVSTRFALEIEGVEPLPVQHHHAHVAACMAEHGVSEPVIGVAFDGTGLGSDGAIWGGEFLIADLCGFERAGHLRYVPLAGGDAAVRQPWRSAAAHLRALGAGEEAAPGLVERVGRSRWRTVMQMTGSPRLAVPTSSVGRLFDAVAALVGLRDEAQFEGQAAIALEMIADESESRRYPLEISAEGGSWLWDPAPLVAGVLADLRRQRSAAEIAGKVHNSVRDAIVVICERLRSTQGIGRVALTGGVFQNALLVERSATALGARGFEVLLHRQVPPNDGGLSLGQAAVACAKLARGG